MGMRRKCSAQWRERRKFTNPFFSVVNMATLLQAFWCRARRSRAQGKLSHKARRQAACSRIEARAEKGLFHSLTSEICENNAQAVRMNDWPLCTRTRAITG